MSNQRGTALIQIFLLLLGSTVAIAQPVQSHAGSQEPRGIQENPQLSFLDLIFPRRQVRIRDSKNPTRSPFDESLPYMLAPRNTALVGTDTLTLQWHPVVGASSYTIAITSSGVDWTTQVSDTEATFNVDVVSLQPNYRYTVVITADNGPSSASDEPVGFQLLPETERARVNAQIEAIKAEQREPDEEALAIALEYFEFQHSDPDWQSSALNQAAIEVLEAQIQAGTEDSRIYLLQADTYLRIGLPLLARERYEEALTYARAAGQQELQAESYWGLGDVAQGQTEYEDALAHLQTAQEFYEGLDDFEQVEELQDQIDAVEGQLPQSSAGQ
jgi:hypothetical protein